jgi:hypothetical protein
MHGLALALLLTAALVAVGVIYLIGPLRAWRRYRGERLVVCPETLAAAAVTIDTGHAALTAMVEGRPDVRLAACSRWAERGRCEEPCLSDVEAAGRAGTVEAIVDRWYRSQACRYCGKPIVASASPHYAPALLGPDGISVGWPDVAAERLPELFRTHQAVCGDCHLIETFRREHADLIVDRP